LLDKQSGQIFKNRHQARVFNVSTQQAFSRYKWQITESQAGKDLQIAELSLEVKEKE